MFCYSEKCKGNHNECTLVRDLNNLTLDFNDFISEEDIKMAREILCLVTSWEEPPYFIVLKRYERGICSTFNGEKIENTKILKWAYLPENTL